MIPHERSLVEKLKDKPFVLLSVNGDSPEDYPEIAKRHNINWRAWLDGDNGPISVAWEIKPLPSTYLIDHEGVIRYKNLSESALDRAIDELIQAAENAG